MSLGRSTFGQDALIERFAEVAARRPRDRCGSRLHQRQDEQRLQRDRDCDGERSRKQDRSPRTARFGKTAVALIPIAPAKRKA